MSPHVHIVVLAPGDAVTLHWQQANHQTVTERLEHPAGMRWVVVTGHGIWARCYGWFPSHDTAMAWVRANGFDGADVSAFPVNHQDGTP